MQVNSVRQNQPRSINFTSVMPVKVLVEGRPVVDKKNIGMVINQLSKIVTSSHKNDPRLKKIVYEFTGAVKDFVCSGFKYRGEVIRHHIDDFGGVFIITGEEASNIELKAKLIGPAKSKGLNTLGTTKTFEVKALIQQYFNFLGKIISDPTSRLYRPERDASGKMIKRIPLELIIQASPKGKYRTTNFRLNVDNISFREIPEMPANTAVKQAVPANVTAPKTVTPEKPTAPIPVKEPITTPTPPPALGKSKKGAKKKPDNKDQFNLKFD